MFKTPDPYAQYTIKKLERDLQGYKMIAEIDAKRLQQYESIVKSQILLIEDGSVDVEELKKLEIPYIVYRQGAAKPTYITKE